MATIEFSLPVYNNLRCRTALTFNGPFLPFIVLQYFIGVFEDIFRQTVNLIPHNDGNFDL